MFIYSFHETIKFRHIIYKGNRMKFRRNSIIEFGFAALCLISYLWALSTADLAAEEAEIKYGANIDSGSHLMLLGNLYLAPLALLFFLSALSLAYSWKGSSILFYLAVSYFLVPIFCFAILLL